MEGSLRRSAPKRRLTAAQSGPRRRPDRHDGVGLRTSPHSRLGEST
jgi:hypothetical protein